VGEIGHLVERFHHLGRRENCCINVAIVACHCRRFVERVTVLLAKLLAIGAGGCPRIPSIGSLAKACLARQKLSATTATAFGNCTTWMRPRAPLIGVLSTLLSLPPGTGQAAIAA
jgi:hypothetical protein